jgi:hypothetical protein
MHLVLEARREVLVECTSCKRVAGEASIPFWEVLDEARADGSHSLVGTDEAELGQNARVLRVNVNVQRAVLGCAGKVPM